MGKGEEIVHWGEREPLAETEERTSGSHKGREPVEQKRGMGTEWKEQPLPRKHPVLGVRKVKEVIAVTVAPDTTDNPDLGPASCFLLLATFIIQTSSSPLVSLLLITKMMHLKCHLLRKTLPDHPI